MPRLPLVPSVHRILCFGTTPPTAGTAWFIDSEHVLTAAHCIGDRAMRQRFAGPIQIQLPGGYCAAAIVREDWDLDAAILKLKRDPATLTDSESIWAKTKQPAGVPAGPLGVLHSEQASRDWYGWGYPDAHSTGMAVNGAIDTLLGNVEGQPAIQLTCEQGGLGALSGLSGGPVCYGEQVVGLVRWGPPSLGHRVIMATALTDLARGFPELRLSAPASVQPAPSMGPPIQRPVSIFMSYAREDKDLVDELVKHLTLMKRQKLITVWTDRPLMADQPYTGDIDERLAQSDLVLLMISPSFVGSDYCFDGELAVATRLSKQKKLRVIPILGRPVAVQGASFSELSPLPSNRDWITEWPSRDHAWVDVVQGIRSVVQSLQKQLPNGAQ